MGQRVDIGAFTLLHAGAGLTIDDDVQVGSHCAIYTVSTIDERTGPVHIGRNARIGSHSTILPGVSIGENAVIGAHSLVTRDIPPMAVAMGVPANVQRTLASPLPIDTSRWSD